MMGFYGWYGWFGFLFMALFWIGLIVVGVWVVHSLLARNRPGPEAGSASEILDRRYARGEITRAEYQEAKKALTGQNEESAGQEARR